MKKFLLITVLALGFATAYAQPRAIGGRLGGNLEASYQHTLGKNMLDCTLGVGLGNYMALNAFVAYDWVFNIKSWPHAGEWNWYVGPGAGVGLFFDGNLDVPVSVNVGGQIGVEYQFNFPLNLSLDYRPMINVLGFGDNTWGYWYGVALGVRYRF